MARIRFGQVEFSSNNAIRHLRASILSNDEDVRLQTDETINGLLAVSAVAAALDVFKRVKRWVNHEDKGLPFLNKCLSDAQDIAKNNPKDFTARQVVAICFKYLKLFDDSEKAYKAAYKLAYSTAERQAVHADMAELYIYMYRIEDAIKMIIDADEKDDWHCFTYAFALHQQAFAQSDDAKKYALYVKSRDILTGWKKLDKNPDALLLIAANWGGMARIKPADHAQATGAIKDFMAKFPDWSIKREKRGPFIKGLPLAADPNFAPDVVDVRKQAAKHFFDNLRACRTDPGDPNGEIPEKRNDDDEPVDDPET